MEKMTKVERFEALITLVEASDMDGRDDMVAFLKTQIEQLETKAAKAKARAAEKRAEADELYDAVFAVLTETPQTIKDIVAQIEGEDITPAKISARLKKMVNANLVEKEQVKIEKSKVMAYRKIA